MKRLSIAFALLLGLVSWAIAQTALVSQLPTGTNVFNTTASNTFTTGSSSAAIAAKSGQWTYLCGFVVTTAGTTPAALGNVTVTGTVGGTMNYEYLFVSSGQGILGIAFGPGCIQSASTATPITVNVPASGGSGTVGAVTAWGFTN
jgi:hypothetical protein